MEREMIEQQMRIGCKSSEMQWILLKFLKDSLDFLSKDEALGANRMDWVKIWQDINLTPESIALWMPKEEPSRIKYKWDQVKEKENNENAVQDKPTI